MRARKNPSDHFYFPQPIVFHNLNHLIVFSCGSYVLALLSLAFSFVLASYYQGKDLGETKLKFEMLIPSTMFEISLQSCTDITLHQTIKIVVI